jgi:hypothetical protein
MSSPGILAIMGSGETAPAMAKVHRALFERLGPDAGPAVIVDTPYGFQENADDLSRRIVAYFQDSVGHEATVATYRSGDVDELATATAVARLRGASYAMAGPGSPSYALRQWAGSPIPDALEAVLAAGGVLTMASAAALTLGAVTVPVYEIYKVGADPAWLDGLDLLGRATGLRAAVVPHYDNAEGGNHDTRFCYLGERRLRVLEELLPADSFVLGVDGHTALVLDVDRRTASVAGLGGVTVRVGGRSAVFPSGTETTIEALAAAATDLASSPTDGPVGWTGRPADSADDEVAGGVASREEGTGLRDSVAHQEGAFVHALEARDARVAVATLLDLDSVIEGRLRRGEDSPDLDSARATFRALLVRLGESAATGVRDPRETLDPFVEALLELRARARASRDWESADLIRDRLAAAGVEVRDRGDGSTWLLEESAGRPS